MLGHLEKDYERSVGYSFKLFFWSAWGFWQLMLFILARRGSDWAWMVATIGTGSGLVFLLASFLFRLLVLRQNKSKKILYLLGQIYPNTAQKILRASSLVEQHLEGNDGSSSRRGSTSRELSELHLSNLWSEIDREKFSNFWRRRARTAMGVTSCLWIALSVISFIFGFGLFEGMDLLFTNRTEAPLALEYVERLHILATFPEYLHIPQHSVPAFSGQALVYPVGTKLDISVVGSHSDRELVLRDGKIEVPFFGSGKDTAIAHYVVKENANLFVSAKFGSRYVSDPNRYPISGIEDSPPRVKLYEAPKTVLMKDMMDRGLQLRYEVSDDHGLSEITLLLRSEKMEERRNLRYLDGTTRFEKGIYVFRSDDSIFDELDSPLQLTVEAKDNNRGEDGLKWGKSESIFISPSKPGEALVMRLDALRDIKDLWVDCLALIMPISKELRTHSSYQETPFSERIGAMVAASELTTKLIHSSYLGVKFPSRFRGMLSKMQQNIAKGMNSYGPSSLSANQHQLHIAIEKMVLVLDVMMASLGDKDARDLALRLASDAEEWATYTSKKDLVHIDSTRKILDFGAESMLALGELGRDLGEIIKKDLSRYDRALKTPKREENLGIQLKQNVGNFELAELVALDLARRLKIPDPSFSSKGGVEAGQKMGESLGPSGTMAGGGKGSGSISEELDDTERAFDKTSEEIQKLAQKQNSLLDETERAGQRNGSEGALRDENEDDKSAKKKRIGSSRPLSKDQNELSQRIRGFGDLLGEEDSFSKQAKEAVKQAAKKAQKAADALEGRSYELAQDFQREALAELEKASELFGADEKDKSSEKLKTAFSGHGDKEGGIETGRGEKEKGQKVDIPTPHSHRGPDAFRERVLKLRDEKVEERIKDALERYTEDLLK